MSNMIKKEDLVNAVATSLGGTKAQATVAVDALFTAVANGLGEGKEVRFTGIGTIKTVSKPATKARNPKTGAQVDVPARVALKFSGAKEMKDWLNGVKKD